MNGYMDSYYIKTTLSHASPDALPVVFKRTSSKSLLTTSVAEFRNNKKK